VEEVHFQSGPYQLFGKLRLKDARAPTILLLHGLGFHSFEYDALAQRLEESGLNSLALDFRCHGRSEGPRGIWVLQDLVEDSDNAVAYLGQRVAGRIGVFGNSLGAIVGVYLAARNQRVESLVASGCPTRVADFAVTRFRKALLGLLKGLAALVPVRVSVNHFIPYRRILRKPRIIEQVTRDPLVSDARRFAPSTYVDILGWNALAIIDQVRVPLLVVYATQDGLQSPDQSIMLFEAARCEKAIRGIDTGHVPDLEDPELLAPILHQWFSRTLRDE
jgi:pimeloyl-ACP methyl ester carboxylesterase